MSDSSVSNPSFWSKWLTDELPHAKLVIKCLRNNWEGLGKTRLSAPGAHLNAKLLAENQMLAFCFSFTCTHNPSGKNTNTSP